MNNTPKSLIVLKAASGANWKIIKKRLLEYLLMKRKIEELNHSLKDYFLELVFKDTNERVPKWISNPKQCGLEKEKLISYTKNALKTLHKLPYDSKIVCFIGDSYNTKKSGNKKYPNLV